MSKKSVRSPYKYDSLLILLGLLFLGSCSGSGEEETARTEREKPPLAVEVLEVSQSRLVSSIDASGTVTGIREALVVSETQGIVEAVQFELGQAVDRGDVLLQVDAEIARLNMEQAAEQLENARIDYQTAQNLVEKGGASRADLLRARSALRGAEARYEQAMKAFEDCSITAPISGLIAQKEAAASLGNYLSPGMRIARIADLSALRLEVSVGEGLIGLVQEGAEAKVTVPAACDQKVFDAEVVAVAAGSNPETGSYQVAIEWQNECNEGIKSGMSAEVSITPQSEEALTIIPSAAVLNRQGENIVFVAEGDQAAQRTLRIGRRYGNRLEVLEGLEPGDLLIISGTTSLSDGDRIQTTVVGTSGSRQ